MTETGYLHNHARMWFASIWIFSLRLPWRLGADFFYRHLLDGDPASNTLSWRWVAGLHTRGKAYAAQAWNIARFTRQRFTPSETDFAADVQGLEATEPEGLPPVTPLRVLSPPVPGRPSVLLITEEDCRTEDFPLARFDIRAAATLAASHLRSPRPVSGLITRFEAEALADAAARSAPDAKLLRADTPHVLIDWAGQAGARQILTPCIPEGPLRDWLSAAAPLLAREGIAVCEWRRDWDTAIWPHATAGFFKVREKMPAILQAAGLS
ncbi:MAG: FAD-binding domain-containing protein [Hyphomonas sp.]